MIDKANADRRVAVVTGGSGAIGGAIAARLAPDHTVVVLDRRGDIAVDLGDPVEVRRAANAVLDRYGRCDVLVHAAAMVAFGPFDEFELEVWRQVQAVNVESALLLTQAFVPGMRDRGFGRVIFIVSNSYWRPPGAHMLAYIASKGALIGMARALAVGLGSDRIAVTAVAPGLTRTPAADVVPAEEFADVSAHQALPRPLTPDDAAAVVAMLAGDDAAALTGQTLTVDGGLAQAGSASRSRPSIGARFPGNAQSPRTERGRARGWTTGRLSPAGRSSAPRHPDQPRRCGTRTRRAAGRPHAWFAGGRPSP